MPNPPKKTLPTSALKNSGILTPEQRRARNKKRFWITFVFILLVFAGYSFWQHSGVTQKYEVFRSFCIPEKLKGQSLETIRGQAATLGFIVTHAEEASLRRDDELFVVRPTWDWPDQFSCWLRIRGGRVEGFGK